MPNTLLRGLYKFRNFFSSIALYDIIKGGFPCMGTSPGKAHAHIDQSESALFLFTEVAGSVAQDLFEKNLSLASERTQH